MSLAACTHMHPEFVTWMRKGFCLFSSSCSIWDVRYRYSCLFILALNKRNYTSDFFFFLPNLSSFPGLFYVIEWLDWFIDWYASKGDLIYVIRRKIRTLFFRFTEVFVLSKDVSDLHIFIFSTGVFLATFYTWLGALKWAFDLFLLFFLT